jgi:hypothetical protein
MDIASWQTVPTVVNVPRPNYYYAPVTVQFGRIRTTLMPQMLTGKITSGPTGSQDQEARQDARCPVVMILTRPQKPVNVAKSAFSLDPIPKVFSLWERTDVETILSTPGMVTKVLYQL